MALNVGDRVKASSEVEPAVAGKIGSIVHIKDSGETIGIRFDDTISNGHNCEEHCELGHGWYLPIEDVSKSTIAAPKVKTKIDEIKEKVTGYLDKTGLKKKDIKSVLEYLEKHYKK